MSEVIKEFLVSLAYKSDEPGAKRMEKQLDQIENTGKRVAKAVIAAGGALQAMVIGVASNLEKLHYSARRTDTTVENLQALESGAQRVGVAAGGATGALENMTRAMRANPGLKGMLQGMGITTEGRQGLQMFMDLLKFLRTQPDYVANDVAAQFGVDPDTLFQMSRNFEEFSAAQKASLEMTRKNGQDMDKAAATAREYMNILRDLKQAAGNLAITLGVELLPTVKEIAKEMKEGLEAITKFIGGGGAHAKKLASQTKTLADKGALHGANDGVFSGLRQFAPGLYDWMVGTNPHKVSGRVTTDGSAAPGVAAGRGGGAAALFARLEKTYGLPAGFLDRMWAKESGRGRNMLSPKGAKGHFQFMDDTAAEMGLDDPNDLTKSATAAARYMKRLMDRYGGDLTKATAAYNWGMGNVDRKGLGQMPAETRGYVADILGKGGGVTFNQETHIKVQTQGDGSSVASSVASVQKNVNADLVRNLQGQVR